MNSRPGTWFILAAFLLIGFGVRVPGIVWGYHHAEEHGVSLHPDENTFQRDVQRFAGPTATGYVRGFSAHVFALERVTRKLFSEKVPHTLLLARAISLVYSVGTLLLLFVVARWLGATLRVALLGCALLALTPVHVINAHFATADTTVTFYFLAASILAFQAARTRSVTLLYSAAVLAGVVLAMKFLLAILLPIAFVTLYEATSRRSVAVPFVVLGSTAGGFAGASLFSYTPADFARLVAMIRYDNVDVTGATTPFENLVYYARVIPTAIGIAQLVCFMGAGYFAIAAISARRREFRALARSWAAYWPYIVFVSGYVAHLALTLNLGINAARHMLPLIPLTALAASWGAVRMLRTRLPERPWVTVGLVVLLAYQGVVTIGYERWFKDDIRQEMGLWLTDTVRDGETVWAHMGFSRVGRQSLYSSPSQEAATYTVTCDLEYNRYFRADSANQIFHAYGGQERLELYRRLFAGQGYERVAEWTRPVHVLEQALAAKGILRDPGTFTPRHCAAFRNLHDQPARKTGAAISLAAGGSLRF